MSARSFGLKTPGGLLATAAATSLLLGGCGGSSPEQEAIRQAATQLHGLGVSGSEPLPVVEDRRARLSKVVKDLGPIAASGNSPQAAAASGILARAQSGLGDIAAREAADLEQDAMGRVTAIRSAFEQWQAQKAIADALRAYDPTPELAKLDDEIAQREAQAARAAEAKAAQVALVAQTRTKAEEARRRVEEFRSQEASIRAAVASGSQSARAAAFEQALSVRRQGDEYEKEAAGFEAVAASQAPEVDTLQNEIDKLTRQVQLLRDAKKSLVARADANRAQADQAAREADEVAASITALLKDLDEARARIAGPTDEAVGLFEKAVSAAKKSAPTAPSSPNAKGAANVAAGNAQQSVADTLASKARGLGAYAAVIQTLHTGGQPGVTAETLSAARQAHAAAVQEAADAYRAAIDMFSAAGGSGDAQERIARLTRSLGEIAGDKPTDPAAEPGTGGQPAAAAGDPAVEKPGGAPAAGEFDVAAVTAEVKAALESMKADSDAGLGAGEFAGKWISAKDESSREMLDLATRMATATQALDKAATEKFGKKLADLVAESKAASVKASPMFGMIAQMSGMLSSQFKGADPATAEIAPVSGTEAVVTVGDAGQPVKMIKADGSWRVDMDGLMGGPQAAQMLAMSRGPLSAFTSVFEAVTGKINAGDYSDADAMLMDLNKELMVAMQKAAPGGGGGSPPGGG